MEQTPRRLSRVRDLAQACYLAAKEPTRRVEKEGWDGYDHVVAFCIILQF